MASTGPHNAPSNGARSGNTGLTIDQVARNEWVKVVAVLTNELRDLQMAEEATQEAFAAALDQWPSSGVPQRPGAWLMTVARRRAIDKIRRNSTGRAKTDLVARLENRLSPAHIAVDASLVSDEQLQLFFACCHPALSVETQIALTLRCVAGLPTNHIARAFMLSNAALGQRLVRGKRKIKQAGISLSMPADGDLIARLKVVHHVLYLIYNSSYVSPTGASLGDTSIAAEAIRLSRLLVGLMPSDPECKGLLALMLLGEARRDARSDSLGNLVLLAEQRRDLWDQDLITESQCLLDGAIKRDQPGPYQIQAAIQMLHCESQPADETDWTQVELLYRSLLRHTDTPVVRLNHGVAMAMAGGPKVGLDYILTLSTSLLNYQYFHSSVGELYFRCEQFDKAIVAFERARDLTENGAEQKFLDQQIQKAMKADANASG